MDKTNAIRLLEANNIAYIPHEYDKDETNATKVASLLNVSAEMVFKTLVTISNSKEHFVFVIPANYSLDLKKAASVAKVKAIEMIHQKELYPLTGYIHGGCSPIGMKKTFKTFINDTALLFDKIYVSAGRVGFNLELNPEVLANFINAEFKDVIKDE